MPDTPPVWPTRYPEREQVHRSTSMDLAGTGGTAIDGRARRLGSVDGVDERPVVVSGSEADVTTTAAADVPSTPASASGEPDPGLDRIITVPTAVTMIRLACIPLYVWILFGADRQTAAALLLAVLGATDWVDGYIARRFHQVSTFGKVLDPVADRVLVVTAVVTIMIQGAVPIWFGVATLAREVVVSAAVLFLASLGAARIDVLWVGKAGTFALMSAYPLFLVSHGTATWQSVLLVVAWVVGLVGLTLAWIAAASYVPVARKALADGRHHEANPTPKA